MNNQDINTIIETCLLSVQGKSDYELLYQNSINLELSRLGIELADYLRFLIQKNDKIKSEQEA